MSAFGSFPEELPDTNKITNIILDRSLPEFVRENHPMFEAFLGAYYEWMEQPRYQTDIISRLREYRDIDRTIDDFVDYFRTEYLINIPTNILADKRLLVKRISDFHRNKGNENSYRFLFRILYGEDIELYYPKIDMLRVSDGKWVQTTTIKIALGTLELNDLAFLFAATLIGNTSGARANVQSVTNYLDRGVNILELDLINIHGTFQEGETLTIDPDDSNHDTITVKQIYSRITMITEGTHYTVGDKIELFNNDSNGATKIGEGIVKHVGRGAVVSIALDDGGLGYSGLLRDVDDFLFLPLNQSISDSNFTGVISDALLSDIADEVLSHAIDEVTVADVPDVIRFIDTPDNIGLGASGYVSHVTQEGEILEIVLTAGGKDYLIPIAEVVSETGSGAVISVTGGGGAIKATQLTTFPVVEPGDDITVDFSLGTGTGATGTLFADNAMIRYKGFFINSDGHLSSNKKLQDNYFYQDFSYVILSSITYDKWKDIVGKILHPAGLKSFGKIKLKTVFKDNTAATIDDDSIITISVSHGAGSYGVTGNAATLTKA